MTERYFKVRNESGAFIDNLYYAKDEVVPLDGVTAGKEPLWGVEVDANGNEIGQDRTGVVADKLANALANQIAGNNGQGKVSDDGEGKGGGTPAGLTDVQKEQVKEALGLLDHANKEHWTARGLPNTETVSGLVGFAVERKDINEVAPGFERQA